MKRILIVALSILMILFSSCQGPAEVPANTPPEATVVPTSPATTQAPKEYNYQTLRVSEHLDDIYRTAHPGSRLKETRERRGMTQGELSIASNIPLRMIQHYEQRTKNLSKASFDTVYRLAQALRVPPHCIVEPQVRESDFPAGDLPMSCV